MTEKPEHADNPTEPPENSLLRIWLPRLGVLLLVFLLGFVPMWISNRQLSGMAADQAKQLSRNRLENSLGSAAVYARRGEYETARQNASSFFTELSQELSKENDGALTEAERLGISKLQPERDEIITLLSRADPASAERLSNLFVEYTTIVRSK